MKMADDSMEIQENDSDDVCYNDVMLFEDDPYECCSGCHLKSIKFTRNL